MNHTELKRLAEAAKAAFSNSYEHTSNRVDFEIAASPDVVLGLIKSLEHTTMAAEAEAEEVDARNAVIDKLCTQNQALVEALNDAARSLETVSKLAGRATYGNPPIETFMQHHDEVRGYAASRAGVAFESLAQAEGGV